MCFGIYRESEIMRARLFLLSLITIVSSVYCFAQEKVVPESVLEALRQQMKQLDTLRADYTVNATTYPSNNEIRYEVSYIKSGDKYNMPEYAYKDDEQVQEKRYVYDGIDIKFFEYTKKLNLKTGSVHPKSFNNVLSIQNNICGLSGFNIIRPDYEKNLDQNVYKNMGKEIIDGHECEKILSIMPYKPPQNAYIYHWIETGDDKYFLIKTVCLIEDDPDQLLYEKRYDYNYSDKYPIPRTIDYERFEIDNNGNRTPEYKKSIVVEDFEVNAPVAESEFVYFFPEGTIVNTTSASETLETIFDPNHANKTMPLQNVTEVNRPAQDNRTVFPVDVNCSGILLPVHINGKEFSFLLDTGATYTFLDTSLKEFLGAPTKTTTVETLGNPMVIQMFESPLIQIGPFNLPKGSDISCIDLSMSSMVDGKTINGVLGTDFIKNHVIQIDFDKGFVSFLREDEIDISSFDQEIEITYDRLGWPKIKGKIINQIDAEFVIDSGNNSSGSLNRETFEKLISLKNVKISETLVVTASGSKSFRLARVESLKIGNCEYKQSLFAEGSYCTLGLVFLSRHIVVFDFPKGKMYLKKSQKYDLTDEGDMSGLHLLRISGNTVVYSADKDSAAEKTGIISGDIIVKINGENAAGLEMSQIRKILKSGNEKKIPLTIERNSQLKEMTLVLEKKI